MWQYKKSLINIIKLLSTVLRSAVDKSHQHRERKILGNTEILSVGRWVRSVNATFVLSTHTHTLIHCLLVLFEKVHTIVGQV